MASCPMPWRAARMNSGFALRSTRKVAMRYGGVPAGMNGMADSKQTKRFRFWLWLIALVGVIVPRRLRADWRREWEAELGRREEMLAEWDRLDWRNKFDLL